MNATMTLPVRITTPVNPFAAAFKWLISAQKEAEQVHQLAEMPIERLRDLGINPACVERETIVPMIHA